MRLGDVLVPGLRTETARGQAGHPERYRGRRGDDDPLLRGQGCERDPGKSDGEQQEERTEGAALRRGGHEPILVARGNPWFSCGLACDQ